MNNLLEIMPNFYFSRPDEIVSGAVMLTRGEDVKYCTENCINKPLINIEEEFTLCPSDEGIQKEYLLTIWSSEHLYIRQITEQICHHVKYLWRGLKVKCKDVYEPLVMNYHNCQNTPADYIISRNIVITIGN